MRTAHELIRHFRKDAGFYVLGYREEKVRVYFERDPFEYLQAAMNTDFRPQTVEDFEGHEVELKGVCVFFLCVALC